MNTKTAPLGLSPGSILRHTAGSSSLYLREEHIHRASKRKNAHRHNIGCHHSISGGREPPCFLRNQSNHKAMKLRPAILCTLAEKIADPEKKSGKPSVLIFASKARIQSLCLRQVTFIPGGNSPFRAYNVTYRYFHFCKASLYSSALEVRSRRNSRLPALELECQPVILSAAEGGNVKKR